MLKTKEIPSLFKQKMQPLLAVLSRCSRNAGGTRVTTDYLDQADFHGMLPFYVVMFRLRRDWLLVGGVGSGVRIWLVSVDRIERDCDS